MNNGNRINDVIYAALFTALIAVLGLVSIPIPISPVPISGQSLAIMLAGSILTTRQAVMSVAAFLLLGAVGVPVISGGIGGLGVIVGPRGGYLAGFLPGAALISKIKGSTNSLWRLAVANLLGGVVVVYIGGVLWLSCITGMSISKALTVGALPFIPGDLCKVFVATVIGAAVNRRLAKARARR